MRYLLVIALAFLFVGSVFADGIPVSADPKNQPHVWTQSVYCAADCTSGYIVQWAFGDSTTTGYTDMCVWAKIADTQGDVWTAGVVPIDYTISAGATGDIIVKGPAIVRSPGLQTQPTVDTLVETNTKGEVIDEASSAEDKAILGAVINPTVSAIRTDLNEGCAIIYVQPHWYENN